MPLPDYRFCEVVTDVPQSRAPRVVCDKLMRLQLHPDDRYEWVSISDWDPYMAIEEELASEKYEAIVLSTLPPGVSRWLRMDLPSRVARRHPEIRLVHVVSQSSTGRSASESPN